MSDSTLYVHHKKIYPREVHGKFAFYRLSGVVGLLGLYYIIPWVQLNGRQAVLFDLPQRKFFVFNLVLWPQDFYLLAALLVILGVSLFLFTALAGRLWCGYSCPQTVWTEVFLWIENRVEGSRAQQMKLDRSNISINKVIRKSLKHTLWLAISVLTAITFVGYFKPIGELWLELLEFELHPWPLFWVLFFTVATYSNAGWLREQVCLYMCPYARFQSAMFDQNTLIISYDPGRGEPRGGRKRNIDHRAAGHGDCINCKMCVQACPTGIDIRDGLQVECIGCAACIDACDDVMEKMDYPKGLIRYTTENALKSLPSKIIRPRSIIYSAILLFLVAGVGYAIAVRSLLEVDVIRDRNVLYRELDDGLIENVFTARILNKDDQQHTYQLEVVGQTDSAQIVDARQPTVAPGGVLDVNLTVRAKPQSSGSQDIVFRFEALDSPDVAKEVVAKFLAP